MNDAPARLRRLPAPYPSAAFRWIIGPSIIKLATVKSPRLSLVVLAALAAPASVRLLADDALPKAQPVARYEPMAARSPFMAPTAPPPAATPVPVQAGPHWWDQMVVTSLMEAGGTYFAAVVDRANNKRYVLESGKTDEESNLLLADVQWNERADQSTVTVRKGAEIAPPLRFDASAVASTPASAPNPFAPPSRNPANLVAPPLPPGFTGTPPPPPPTTSVVRRSSPIGARPVTPADQGSIPRPPVQPQGAKRQIRPLGGNTDSPD